MEEPESRENDNNTNDNNKGEQAQDILVFSQLEELWYFVLHWLSQALLGIMIHGVSYYVRSILLISLRFLKENFKVHPSSHEYYHQLPPFYI